MVAAAYKVSLTFRCLGSGRKFGQYATASDVAAEYYVFSDGQSVLQLPANEGIIELQDVQLSAAGTDTAVSEVFAGGASTGFKILNAANLATNLSRQLMLAPLQFKPATQIRFKQAAS